MKQNVILLFVADGPGNALDDFPMSVADEPDDFWTFVADEPRKNIDDFWTFVEIKNVDDFWTFVADE